MKKIVLALFIVAGLSLTATAQETKSKTTKAEKRKDMTPAERAKSESNHAEKKLALTADQKAKWESAALERINANAPHKEKLKGSTTPEERKTIHQDMKANKEKFDNAVTGFLTAEQKTKWEKMKEERRKKLREKHKGKPEHEIIDDED